MDAGRIRASQILISPVKLLPRTWAWTPKMSFRKSRDSPIFPHVTRACEGVVFDSVETVKTLISRTSTSKGLTTIVHILDKIYETGRKYAADFKEIMPIVFDTHLPKWNYRAIPQE
ncbi:hypothetical protein BMR09_11385 [Methylococcaceae bacterium CS3]|nr:hypothetical protein BMR09_11385 [Methylococcaceae bacterium CS3]